MMSYMTDEITSEFQPPNWPPLISDGPQYRCRLVFTEVRDQVDDRSENTVTNRMLVVPFSLVGNYKILIWIRSHKQRRLRGAVI